MNAPQNIYFTVFSEVQVLLKGKDPKIPAGSPGDIFIC